MAKKRVAKKSSKKKAKKKATSSVKKVARKTSAPAYMALNSILGARRYTKKDMIVAKLLVMGYDTDIDRVSYIMTSARKHGHLCVHVRGKKAYTAVPSGSEAHADMIKRRKISEAWVRNTRPLRDYVVQNHRKISRGLSGAELTELANEVEYNRKLLDAIVRLKRRYSLR